MNRLRVSKTVFLSFIAVGLFAGSARLTNTKEDNMPRRKNSLGRLAGSMAVFFLLALTGELALGDSTESVAPPAVQEKAIEEGDPDAVQSRDVRDHRGQPPQVAPPSQMPVGPGFGTPLPGLFGSPTLAKFHMLELGTYPPTFLTGDAVSSFYLVYQCEVEGRPCSARQDVINVIWTVLYKASGPNEGIRVLKIPGRVLHGAQDSSCEGAIKKKYPGAGCFHGMTHTETGDYKVFAEPGLIFRSILAVGSETAYKDFLVERTQPSPRLKIGRPQIVDHR